MTSIYPWSGGSPRQLISATSWHIKDPFKFLQSPNYPIARRSRALLRRGRMMGTTPPRRWKQPTTLKLKQNLTFPPGRSGTRELSRLGTGVPGAWRSRRPGHQTMSTFKYLSFSNLVEKPLREEVPLNEESALNLSCKFFSSSTQGYFPVKFTRE